MSRKNAELTTRLAMRLKEERKAKSLSLDALSKLSGVSRSMLSQIERGESSPTVASLWSLTQALKVDFSTLLDREGSAVQPIRDVQRADRTPVIRNRAEGCTLRILSAPKDVGGHEVYDIDLAEGAAIRSAAHKRGCIEHLTVLTGSLTVESADQSEEVREGDTIRYAADVEHCIRADSVARILLIVQGA